VSTMLQCRVRDGGGRGVAKSPLSRQRNPHPAATAAVGSGPTIIRAHRIQFDPVPAGSNRQSFLLLLHHRVDVVVGKARGPHGGRYLVPFIPPLLLVHDSFYQIKFSSRAFLLHVRVDVVVDKAPGPRGSRYLVPSSLPLTAHIKASPILRLLPCCGFF